ncbi:hypothetical protein BHE74_00041803 [Ensete ventricosum]|uniref:Uncharacterized protein n=1 Tax=Ensete ventricosum TaxID=4639 RepID=A0A444CDP3_ENSVE|nr:hypothetical protein GW17_00054343 [Ensete ventricosum]RWW51825.1 hypothetical protein BHE74_00041803 [Ensete ventricosum]RZR73216.1 hypothetical protein BHM03_00021509 [Ensete ventricosum]
MASSPERGDDGSLNGSLFDGMVLFTPSSFTDPSLPQPGASPPPDVAAASQPQPKSQPFDEDLFSDLTIQTPPSPTATLRDSPPPPTLPPLPSSPRQPPALLPRQPSRKKKRAVRVGYARETAGAAAASSDDSHHISDPLCNKSPPPSCGATAIAVANESMADEPLTSPHDVSVDSAAHHDAAMPAVEDDLIPAPPKSLKHPGEEADEGSSNEAFVNEGKGDQPPTKGGGEEEETCSSGGSATGEGVFGSAEERLQLVRTQISKKLESVRQRAASAYAERKELERSRRRAVESVNAASTKHRDLEKDLEVACEAEDFETAERVSENLMTVEEEKAKLLLSLREAEADCELAELKMQEVLELQIAVEEECIDLLEQFAKVRMSTSNLDSKIDKKLLE